MLGLAWLEGVEQGPSILTQRAPEQRFLYDLYGRHEALILLEIKQIALLREPARLATLNNPTQARTSKMVAMHPAQAEQLLKAPTDCESRSVEQVVDSWDSKLPVQEVNAAMQIWTPIAELILRRM